MNLLRQLALTSIVALSSLHSPLSAQWKADLHSTITSRHYWRGLMVSNSVNYEGNLTINKNKFTLGAWGGYAFNGDYSEFDIHMEYQIFNNLQLSVWDLYASRDRASIDDYNYFDFDRSQTNHLFDASLHYSVSKTLPLTIHWSTLLWGRDLDNHQNQNYSSYFEVDYSFKLDQLELKTYVGINVFENSLYAKNTNVVNIGFIANKELKISDNLAVPIWFQLAMNPEKEASNIIVGLCF